MIRTKDEVIKYISSTLNTLNSKKNRTLFKMVAEGCFSVLFAWMLLRYYKQNSVTDMMLALGFIISTGLTGYSYLMYDTYARLISRGQRLLKQLKLSTTMSTSMRYRIRQYLTNIRHYVDNDMDMKDINLASVG